MMPPTVCTSTCSITRCLRSLRNDAGYPKVEWNAFAATGQGQGSWIPTETKYYPLIDDIAPLGFEDVVIDVGWWHGDTTHQPHPPVGHAELWPKGMLAASQYAHQNGMRFGLYWNCNSSMTTADGMQHRKDDIKYLFDQFQVDFYRSDGTAGNVLQTGNAGPGSRAHYAEDLGYWQTKGFYEVIDWLYANVPNFSYENCSGRRTHQGLRSHEARHPDPGPGPVLPHRCATSVLGCLLCVASDAALHAVRFLGRVAGLRFRVRVPFGIAGAPYWHPDAPNGGKAVAPSGATRRNC